MIDFTTIRLNRERLHAAAEARQRRATWVVGPSPINRLCQALGAQLIALGRRMQTSAARANVYR